MGIWHISVLHAAWVTPTNISDGDTVYLYVNASDDLSGIHTANYKSQIIEEVTTNVEDWNQVMDSLKEGIKQELILDLQSRSPQQPPIPEGFLFLALGIVGYVEDTPSTYSLDFKKGSVEEVIEVFEMKSKPFTSF